MFNEADLTPMSVWVHPKGGLYVVLGVATCSTTGLRGGAERSVVYYSVGRRALHYRKVYQFLDGRFTPHPAVNRTPPGPPPPVDPRPYIVATDNGSEYCPPRPDRDLPE